MNIFRSRDTDTDTAPPGSWTMDPKELIARFRRRLPLFATVAGSVFLVAAGATLMQKPVYTASAQVLIDPREKELFKEDTAVVSALPRESGVVDTEVRLIASRELAEKVVRGLKLDRDPEFRAGGGGGFNAVRASLGGGGASTTPDKTVDKVMNRLAVRRSGLTYVIDVNFSSGDPKKAALVANAFAEEYLRDQLSAKQGATATANDWLGAKLDEMRLAAEQADAELQYYKIANNLMSADGQTIAEQEISVLNQQIAEAQAMQAEREGRLAAARAQLRRGGGGADTAAALGSDVVRELRSQRAEVSRRKADLETRYGPMHPELQKVNQELADFDGQIKQEISRIQSNLEAEVQVARQRTSSLLGSRSAAKGGLASNNRAQVGLMELERKAEANRAIYEAFLNRSKETAAQAGINSPDARIVSKAKAPSSPSSPNTPLNLALGLAFALMAGMASVVAAETLDGGVRTQKDLKRKFGLGSLGSIPTLSSVATMIDRGALKPEDYVLKRPKSAFAEAFRSLKTSLIYAKPGETAKVVAVTSAMPEEGKTLTTFCLARIAAVGGSRVVVIDCDLRHRSLSQRVKGPVKTGLFELLNGKASLEDVLRRDEPSGAFVLPIAENAWSDPDVFRSPPMQALLTRLRAEFDLVLLDTPPVLAVSDTRVLAGTADAVLYLLRWGKTPEMAARNALEQLEQAGAFVPGIALTQVDMRQQAATGYGDSGYYYESYKKYYTED